MSKKALFIIPPERFNEDELFKPKNILEAAGVEVTVASTRTGEVIGDGQGTIDAEQVYSDVSASDFDAIAVIGGSGTNDFFWGNEDLYGYIKQAHADKVLVTGICAGAVTVAQTGLLNGREATCYPLDVQTDQLKSHNVTYTGAHVVAHEDIITGDGPMGAEDFGQALAKALL